MASLLLNQQIELLGYGVPSLLPSCAGATFYLGPSYDLGVQQPIVDILAELSLDGERPFGQRSGNRTVTLPIVITAPDLDTLAGARETLLTIINQRAWTMTFTRDGGLPIVFDCFRAGPAVPVYSVSQDRQQVARITVTFPALPFGHSDIPVQLTFASPISGSPPPPPSPVLLDDYETPSGSHWSASAAHITGIFSAHWSPPSAVNAAPTYSSTFAAADITGRGVLQHWAGFATGTYGFVWGSRPMAATFAYALYDAGGRTLRFGSAASVAVSPVLSSPNWALISANIPASGSFDYAHVVRCDITISNFAGTKLDYADAFLDDLTAQPATTAAPASTRGSLYTLHGIQGTSHAPLSLQFEQPPASTPTVTPYSTPGTFQFIPGAGVTSIDKIEATGASGAGGGRSSSGQAAGAGGGEYAAITNYPCTPGVPVTVIVGAAGTDGATPVNGGNSSFGGAALVAHGSASVAQNATTGTAGGTGSTAPTHFDGGAGANSGAAGGGGGAAASASGPGAAGSGATGGTGPSGDGGTGGAAGDHPGGPGTGPGGGGAGASSTGTTQPGGLGAAGSVVVTCTQQQPLFKTLIAHRPGPDSPVNLTPFVSTASVSDPPDGRQYPVTSQVAGQNARFSGTYTVIAVANSFASPSSPRTVSVTVQEVEYPGGPSSPSVTDPRTFTPSTDISGGIVVLGELTLPSLDIPPDNTSMYHTAGITDSNTADQYLDILFLSTTGQTVIINSPIGYAAYYLDEPDTSRDIGRVLGTNLDRTQAISVLDEAFVSGGPLTVDPGDNALFCYCVEGAPAVLASYRPHFYLDRTS